MSRAFLRHWVSTSASTTEAYGLVALCLALAIAVTIATIATQIDWSHAVLVFRAV